VVAALIGNGQIVEVLPLQAEPVAGGRARLLSPSHDARVRPQLSAVAAAAFDACGCRDHAVIRLAFDRDGRALVSSVDPSPTLALRSVFVQAAVASGYTYAGLVSKLLDAAHERYFGVPAPRFEIPHVRDQRASSRVPSAEPY
jgi:hypothetical protein